MTRSLRSLAQAWDDAAARYAHEDLAQAPTARFNLDLLAALRPRWGSQIRVTTSMFRLMFTRPDEHHYDESTTEWITVELSQPGRVEMALMRRRPRLGLDKPGGIATVTGDFTKPEKAVPAVEALLWQLAEPNDA